MHLVSFPTMEDSTSSFLFHSVFGNLKLQLPIPFTDSEEENVPADTEQVTNKGNATVVQEPKPLVKNQTPIKLISNVVIHPTTNKKTEAENPNSPSKSVVTAIRTAQNKTPTKATKHKLLLEKDASTPTKNTGNRNSASPKPSSSKNAETGTPAKFYKNKLTPKAYCKTSTLTNRFKKIYNEIMSLTHLKILLTEKERATLADFAKMDEQYVFFCLNLFLNAKSWTNVFKYRDKLKVNMTDFAVTNMCKILERRGYFLTDYKETESTRALLQILELADVKGICESLKITIPPRERQLKSEIIHVLVDFCKQDGEDSTQDANDLDAILRKEIFARLGFCVKLCAELCTALKKLHVLYSFPNEDVKGAQKLYEFLEKIERNGSVLPQHYVHNMEPFHSSTEFTE